jgi:hypothetical protein
MAESRPPAKPRSQGPASNYTPRPPKETVDERRARQSAAALAAQVDLKREAAERRERKSSS